MLCSLCSSTNVKDYYSMCFCCELLAATLLSEHGTCNHMVIPYGGDLVENCSLSKLELQIILRTSSTKIVPAVTCHREGDVVHNTLKCSAMQRLSSYVQATVMLVGLKVLICGKARYDDGVLRNVEPFCLQLDVCCCSGKFNPLSF